MSVRLERQRWLGVLALAVAAPLPLTGIVSWPFLAPFLAVAVTTLVAPRVLKAPPVWLENVLALAIVVLVLVAGGGARFGVLHPVSQLAVLVAAVRLPGAHEQRRIAMAFGLIALVGVAGIASSTHPLLAVYLIVFLALVVAAVARLQTIALAEASATPLRSGPWPPAMVVVTTVAIAVLAGAVIFVLSPRLRSPFAAASYGGGVVSGFRGTVSLNAIGDIKESQRPALHVRFPGASTVSLEWLRLAGATSRHYRHGLWAQGRKQSTRLVAGASHKVTLVERPASALQWAEISLERPGDTLFVPVGTQVLELPDGIAVWRDSLGGLHMPRGASLPIRYGAGFVPGDVVQSAPDEEDLSVPPGYEAVRSLAEQVTQGARGSVAAALSLEGYLRQSYRYTTRVRLSEPGMTDPVLWFLFDGRRGHCEFFAASMVLLLRTVGIPARLQVGYAGGEAEGGGSFLVRDSQAHAWVVAWVGGHAAGGRGSAGAAGGQWRVFDPTPSDGRPGLTEPRGGAGLGIAWQKLETAWDRWVLTFSLADQVDLVTGAARFVRSRSMSWRGVGALVAVLLFLIGSLRVVFSRLRARPPQVRSRDPLSRAMERIVAAARERGVIGGEVRTPREIASALSAGAPQVGEALHWLVKQHELHVYNDAPAPPRPEIRARARSVTRALAAAPGGGQEQGRSARGNAGRAA